MVSVSDTLWNDKLKNLGQAIEDQIVNIPTYNVSPLFKRAVENVHTFLPSSQMNVIPLEENFKIGMFKFVFKAKESVAKEEASFTSQ